MNPWFIWKGKNSLGDFGLWINKLPKIVRAPERYKEITIPGRAGSLIMTEGEDVYDSYLKECTVIIRHSIDIQKVLEWLRGSGEVVFSNEIHKAYNARIAGQVAFQRISNDMSQAVVPFFVEPFKTSRNPEQDRINLTAASTSKTAYNPGDIASKPIVVIEGTEGTACSLTIAGTQMTFYSIPEVLVIDCDSRTIFSAGLTGETLEDIHIIGLYTGRWYGEYWKIPKGRVQITKDAGIQVTIHPNWRWV